MACHYIELDEHEVATPMRVGAEYVCRSNCAFKVILYSLNEATGNCTVSHPRYMETMPTSSFKRRYRLAAK